MVTCARCGRDVDTAQNVTLDVITKEVIDSIDTGQKDPPEREGDMKVCAGCMDELERT